MTERPEVHIAYCPLCNRRVNATRADAGAPLFFGVSSVQVPVRIVHEPCGCVIHDDLWAIGDVPNPYVWKIEVPAP